MTLSTLALVALVGTAHADPMSFEALATDVGDDSRYPGSGDVDGDGDTDIVFMSSDFEVEVWLNDGTGVFTQSFVLAVGVYQQTQLVDMDFDGCDDVVLSTGRATEFLASNCDGTLADPILVGASSAGAALGDINGDGHIDLVVGVGAGGGADVYHGDGAYGFEFAYNLETGDSVHGLQLGDIDGDGDLDGVLGFVQSHLLVNDGGTLSVAGEFGPEYYARYVNLADFDGDGDLDSYISDTFGGGSVLMRNDGAGNFTEEPVDCDAPGARQEAVMDLDGDGDLDIYSTQGGGDEICVNDGSGVFTGGIPFDVDGTTTTLGDWDGDGDGDVFVSDLDGLNTILENQANPEPLLPPIQVTVAIDGTLDLTVDGSALLEGDRIVVGASANGLGDGPCWGVLGGECMGLATPIFPIVDTVVGPDATHTEEGRRLPRWLPEGSEAGFQVVLMRDGAAVALSEPTTAIVAR